MVNVLQRNAFYRRGTILYNKILESFRVKDKGNVILTLTLALPDGLMEFCKVALTFKSANEIL